MSSTSNTETISQEELTARYQRAAHLEDSAFDETLIARNTTLFPHWVEGNAVFWYQQDTPDGHGYRLVDASAKTNQSAFDHSALATALAEASAETVEADKLPLVDLAFTAALDQINFTAFGQRWCYHLESQQCASIDSLPDQWVVSPNGQQAAFVRDHNLWVRDLVNGKEKALTHDGERYRDYALSQPLLSHGIHQPSVSVEAVWSPDSRRLFTVLIDIRHLEVGPPLVQHVPTDGSLRPKILRADRRVAFAGDEHIACYQLLAIDVDTGVSQPADYPPSPLTYPPYAGYFTGHRGWWDADSRHGYFIDQERGGKTVNLVKLDTFTGKTEVLIQETSDTAVTVIPISHISTLVIPLPDTNELIWFSERSGWAHLYLYELSSGRLKNTVTEGEWLVRNVLHFDASRRELFIQTAGRVSGRNPYYCDLCRVNIDSGALTTIVSSDHDYVVCDQRSRISARDNQALGVSSCGDYVVTTRSRVDQVPVSILFDRDGNELLCVETADTFGLPANWQWPEPIMVKSADDTTDIMAVVFRPTDFDPNKSYPILDHSYGYASPVGSFGNSHVGGRQYFSPAACAELGFIVVVVHNRGKDALRHVAFAAYQDPDFPEEPHFSAKSPVGDSVAAIKQLAERYPYMDVNRVGIMESGSQPLALSGMLVHPGFYKVGVSNCGCADGRMLAAQGMAPIGDEYRQFEHIAGNLQGKFLIISGMLEWAMPVAMTFRVIQALQEANKRFDMILVPNSGHGRNSYTIQRSWDYVVEHLLGQQPPEDYCLDVIRGRLMDQEIKMLETEYEG